MMASPVAEVWASSIAKAKGTARTAAWLGWIAFPTSVSRHLVFTIRSADRNYSLWQSPPEGVALETGWDRTLSSGVVQSRIG